MTGSPIQEAAPQPSTTGAAQADSRSVRATARWAGIFYLLMVPASVLGYLYVPAHFYVTGDAGATAARIVQDIQLYRLALVSSLIGQLFFIFTALALYQLFGGVQRAAARLLLVLVCVGVAVEIGSLVNRAAPLVLLSGAGYLAAFTRPQLEALAYAFLRIGGQLASLVTIFWGLWLFPFGYLTIRSRYFPKLLGYLLYISGFAYVVTSIAEAAFPAQAGLVTKLVTPLYYGELVMVLWLPIVGARVPAEA